MHMRTSSRKHVLATIYNNKMSSEDIDNLQSYIVQPAPHTIHYIPDFITVPEEHALLRRVHDAPRPKWTQLLNRRLQNWGGLPHPKGMLAEDLPQWLNIYAKKIAALGVFKDKVPNHVLVNEYLPGQGIMPHEDGPLFFPVVSTISLGSHTLLDFYYHLDRNSEESETKVPGFGDRHFLSLLLEPRSLVLVLDDMYEMHLHGIEERTEDLITKKVANLASCSCARLGDTLVRDTRISLTIRYVPKILKAKLFLGKR